MRQECITAALLQHRPNSYFSRPYARFTIDIRTIVVRLAIAVIAHLSLIDDRDKGFSRPSSPSACMCASNEARRKGSRSVSTGHTVQYSVLPVSSLMIRLACALSLSLRGRLYHNTSRSEVRYCSGHAVTVFVQRTDPMRNVRLAEPMRHTTRSIRPCRDAHKIRYRRRTNVFGVEASSGSHD